MPNEPDVPDIHADLVQIACTDLSVILGLQALAFPLQTNEESSDDTSSPSPELKAIVRLSPTQAKIFAIMLKRALQELEGRDGLIPLPSGILEQLKRELEEW